MYIMYIYIYCIYYHQQTFYNYLKLQSWILCTSFLLTIYTIERKKEKNKRKKEREREREREDVYNVVSKEQRYWNHHIRYIYHYPSYTAHQRTVCEYMCLVWMIDTKYTTWHASFSPQWQTNNYVTIWYQTSTETFRFQ